MKLEDEIRRAIERRTDDGVSSDWPDARDRFVRAYRRRGITRAVLATATSVSLVAGLALGAARLGDRPPAGFVDQRGSSMRGFRYTASVVAAEDGVDAEPVKMSGSVDLRRGRKLVRWHDQNYVGIVANGSLYAHMTDEGPTAWVRAPYDPREAAVFGGELAYAFPSDPASYLDTLRAKAAGVAERGTATIRGIRTTRYDVTLDIAKVIASAQDDARAFYRVAYREPQHRVISVWVDETGLTRRIVTRYRLPLFGKTGELSATIDLASFDEPEAIDPPQRVVREVDSIEQLLGAQQGMTCTATESVQVGGDAPDRSSQVECR